MSKKAIVADSDFFFVEFLSGLLEKRGYSVRKAYDGKQAVASLEEGPCDILFADLVMPKISGRRFFEFVRQKVGSPCFPLVAVSGTVIEQMDDLETIGADYFIAKGPFQKLEVHLNEFISALECRPDRPPTEKTIIQTGGVFPRRDAMELLNVLKFTQAVIESLGVGVLVIDSDTRVIHANDSVLSAMRTSIVDVLNRPVLDLFPPTCSHELIAALKSTGRGSQGQGRAFFVGSSGRMLRAVITPLRIKDAHSGWLLALENSI